MRRYEAYRDSGIEWIGAIPLHWELGKIKNWYKFQIGFTPETDRQEYYSQDGIDWVTIADLENRIVSSTKSKISLRYIRENHPPITPKGSLLYSFKLSVGKTAFAGKELYTNEAIGSFIDSKEKLDFLKYSSILIGENSTQNVYGSKILNLNLIKNAPIIFPPIEEQRRISLYLEHKSKAIEQIKELLSLQLDRLNHYKKVLIAKILTKGVENLPLKQSGIEWIGAIPEHWELTNLAKIATIRTGNMNTEEAQENGVYPFYVRSPIVRHSRTFTFDTDAVLISGDGAGAGKIFHKVHGKFGCHQRVYCIESKDRLNIDYLYLQLSTFFPAVIEAWSAKSTVDSVRLPMLKSFQILLPPIEEQVRIADYLNRKIGDLDDILQKIEMQLEKLNKYRHDLISAVVTGKVCVF